MQRPWLSAIAAAAFLLTLAAPAFAMTLGNSLQRQFDPTHEIRGGVNAAAEALGPGALGPIRVLVTFPGGNADDAPRTPPLGPPSQTRIAEAPDVVNVSPPVFGDDNRSALLSVVLSIDPEETGARETVDWLRANVPEAAGDRRRDRRRRPDRADQGLRRQGRDTQPLVFVFVAFIAFVMLLISIRSVFLAFKGVLMTVLSVAAAYGSLVVVFEWGWFESTGIRAADVAGQHHPAAGPGDDVRPVDGLRDLPADPHPRALPADRRTPATRSPTASAPAPAPSPARR